MARFESQFPATLFLPFSFSFFYFPLFLCFGVPIAFSSDAWHGMTETEFHHFLVTPLRYVSQPLSSPPITIPLSYFDLGSGNIPCA